jgi:hypothetical protein
MKHHTHADLVVIASRWLKNTQRCGLILTEMSSGCAECPDAIGWISSGMSHLIECKISRADFLADRDKWFRNEMRGEAYAMGNFRWYLTPPALVLPGEIKGQWGLIEAHGRSVREIVPAHAYYNERRHEFILLTSAVRRMANTPGVKGIHCRVYTEKWTIEPRATVYARPLPPNNHLGDNRCFCAGQQSHCAAGVSLRPPRLSGEPSATR